MKRFLFIILTLFIIGCDTTGVRRETDEASDEFVSDQNSIKPSLDPTIETQFFLIYGPDYAIPNEDQIQKDFITHLAASNIDTNKVTTSYLNGIFKIKLPISCKEVDFSDPTSGLGEKWGVTRLKSLPSETGLASIHNFHELIRQKKGHDRAFQESTLISLAEAFPNAYTLPFNERRGGLADINGDGINDLVLSGIHKENPIALFIEGGGYDGDILQAYFNVVQEYNRLLYEQPADIWIGLTQESQDLVWVKFSGSSAVVKEEVYKGKKIWILGISCCEKDGMFYTFGKDNKPVPLPQFVS